MSNQQQIGQQVAVAPQRAPLTIAEQAQRARSSFVVTNIEEAWRFGQLLAKAAQGVPKVFRENEGLTFVLVMQAMEWGVSPLQLAQSAFVVNDRLAYEAKVFGALLKTSGVISDYDFEFVGEPFKTRKCLVTFLLPDGRKITHESPQTSLITTKNSPLWKSDEDQQLGYYTIRAAARLRFPHVVLGFVAPDDVPPEEPAATPARMSTVDKLDALSGPTAGQAVEAAAKAVEADTPAAEEKPKRAPRKAAEQKVAEKQPEPAVTPANVMQQPLVQETLKQFPGAQVVDIRTNAADAGALAEVWGEEPEAEQEAAAPEVAPVADDDAAPFDVEEDEEEVSSEDERVQIRMAELDHVPKGIDKDDILQCRRYLEGYDAAVAGKPLTVCPPEIMPGRDETRGPEFIAWVRGHDAKTGDSPELRRQRSAQRKK